MQSLGIKGAVVGRELHEDGFPHLHAFVCFTKQKDVRNPRYFDFRGHHGNYQSCIDTLAWITYCKKDGDFIEWGDVPKAKRKWNEVLSAGSKEEALSIAAEVSPRDYVLSFDRIESFLAKKFKPVLPEYTPDFTFQTIPNIVQVWKDQMHERRPKSLILWGPTRTGKTELARSFGKHMYFNGLFNLDKLDPDATYAVFDDWDDWSKFWNYKQWIGAQREFDATDKYRSKRVFTWGKPCIILSNTLPNFTDMAWIRSNCFILNVQNKLF